MYTGLLHSHSWLAYLLLAGLLITIINSLLGYSKKRPFEEKDRKIALLGLIPAHLQGLIGIVLYFVSPNGVAAFSGNAMKDSVTRLYILEHPLTMIIALVLITVGYVRAKKLKDSNKRFSSLYIFYGISLLLVLIRIPWNAWP